MEERRGDAQEEEIQELQSQVQGQEKEAELEKELDVSYSFEDSAFESDMEDELWLTVRLPYSIQIHCLTNIQGDTIGQRKEDNSMNCNFHFIESAFEDLCFYFFNF